MSDIETLRRAAEKLRQHAKMATPGPWRTHDTYVPAGGYTATVLVGEGNDTRPVAWVPSFSNEPNEIDRQAYPDAIYIAAMHPGVALLLADWLEATARRMGYTERGVDPAHALALAREILGEDGAR